MEDQHAGLAKGLDDLAAKAASWRNTSAALERDTLAGAATELLARIAEHLGMEEREVLPSSTTTSPRRNGRRSAGRG